MSDPVKTLLEATTAAELNSELRMPLVRAMWILADVAIEIRDVDPDAEWVESWKFLARWMKDKARDALAAAAKEVADE